MASPPEVVSDRHDTAAAVTSPSGTFDQVLGTARDVAAGAANVASGAAQRVAAVIGVPLTAEVGPRYSAFISYSHADMAFARWLHRAIETYRVPKPLVGTAGEYGPIPAKLRPVFRDEDELAGASELGPKLEAALRDASALIVICSPRSAKSAWVDKEIRTFKRLNPDRHVFAVIARGVPGDPDNECFPEPLCYQLLTDGTTDRTRPLEPLAPDAQKLDKRAVRLKIIAGMLGIGYGPLADREHRRARARTAAVATVSTMLVIVLSLLSIAAIGYARVAVAERKRTEVALADAVKARDLAQRRAWLAQQAATSLRALSMEPTCPEK